MSKITQYASIGTPAASDLIPVVDLDDTSMAASGTTKTTTVSSLLSLAGLQVVTFTFGAGGAVPSSGTFTTGTVAVDQNNIVRVCTAGGTPGTWIRAGADPHDFWVDDFGAKGDGRLALVNTTAGSAVINTMPLGAPATPSPTNTATGGTVLAGVYGVKVTYLNEWGETVASAAGTTTTTGSTSVITVPFPAFLHDALSANYYVTQANGATYTLQNTSPIQLGGNLILTAPPTSNGVQPPGSDTTAARVFTSTGVDGGKNIMICGGLGTPGGPWIDTILSVQSATQATLSTNGASQGGNVTQTGCAMVFSSDDRIAIDNCHTAAEAYAMSAAGNFLCKAHYSSKLYGVGTGVFQGTPPSVSLGYNTQVRIPAGNNSEYARKLDFQMLGPGESDNYYYWLSEMPTLAGTCIISYCVGPATADPTFGQQSVIGAAETGSSNFAGGSNGFYNVKATILGISVVMPGWNNTIGIDFDVVSAYRLRGSSHVFAPGWNGNANAINPSSGWVNNSFWQQKIGAGLRSTREGNNDNCIIDSFTTEGITIGVLMQGDHFCANRLAMTNVFIGVGKTGGDTSTHMTTIQHWSIEGCSGAILKNMSGDGNHMSVYIRIDGENSGPAWDIDDPGNSFYGRIEWSDPFRATSGLANTVVPVVRGAANVEIINNQLPRQMYDAHAYAYTLGTAFQNPWWMPMTVTLAGGTVTGISIGPPNGTAAGTMTSLGITSGTFRLPSGWWINIAGSVKPTTFLAVPG